MSIMLVILCSCKTTQPIYNETTDNRPKIEQLSSQTKFIIQSQNDSSYQARNVIFQSNHLVWNEYESPNIKKELDYQYLKNLQYTSRKSGRRIGFIFGLLTGFSIGMANSGGGGEYYSIDLGPEIGVISGLVNGATWSIIGHIIGYKTVYSNN